MQILLLDIGYIEKYLIKLPIGGILIINRLNAKSCNTCGDFLETQGMFTKIYENIRL